jgi:acetylglutamate kinase
MTAYVVIKVGGHSLASLESRSATLDSLALGVVDCLNSGRQPVVIHGAGPQISAVLVSRGIESQFREGLRVTSLAAMDVVAESFRTVNALIVSGLIERGVSAVTAAGDDNGLIVSAPRSDGWERTGGSVSVSRELLLNLLDGGAVTVINPIAVDQFGEHLNCNADTVAGAVATALDAEALILLSDVDQLRNDPDDAATSLSQVSRAEISTMKARGAIRDGMVPKLDAALVAMDAGANCVMLVNAARPNGLTDALHRRGVFTEVVA